MEELGETLVDSPGTPAGSWRPAVSTTVLQERFGRFAIRTILGKGGFGKVFRAYDPLTDREIALKVPTFGADETDKVERFTREAKAAGRLRHPNIVLVLESGLVGDQLFIASEFIDGKTLAAVLREGKPERKRAVQWAQAMAEGLAYAHGEGIIHRDVKPQNTMIDRLGRPQIMDFGLAKRIDDATLTADSSLLGTPAYMSPEQAQGSKDVGTASDQYALGVVLYEMLCGRTPFLGTVEVQISHHVRTQPPRPRSIDPSIPLDLEAICLKALEKDPAHRYATMSDFGADLERWLAGEPTRVRPLKPIERLTRWVRRNPVIAGSSLVVGAVALIALAVVSWALGEAIDQRNEAFNARTYAEGERETAQRERVRAEQGERAARQSAESERTAVRAAQRQLYVAQMGLAEKAWNERRIARVRELLAMQVPAESDQEDLRGWEWDYQNRLLQQEERALTGQGRYLAISPDGSRIAISGRADNTIRICDINDLATPVQVLKGHQGEVWDIAFHPGGHRLASTDRTAAIHYWDLDRGTSLWTIANAAHGVWNNRVSFTTDGTKLAIGSQQGAAVIDAKDMWPRPMSYTTIGGKYGTYARAAAISADGRFLAAGSPAGDVRIWDRTADTQLLTMSIKLPPRRVVKVGGEALGIEFDPTSKRLAVAVNPTGSVLVIDATSGEIVWQRGTPGESKGQGLYSIAYSPDGATIVTGGEDSAIRFWDAGDGTPGPVLYGHESAVTDVVFLPDGEHLVSSDKNQNLRTWDLASSAAETRLAIIKGPISSYEVDPQGDWFVVIPHSGYPVPWPETTTAYVIDPAGQRDVQPLAGHSGVLSCNALSPDGTLLAIGARDGRITIWRMPDGIRDRTIDAHTGTPPPGTASYAVERLTFSQDGHSLISQGNDGLLRWWDVATWELHQERSYEASYHTRFAVHSSGRWGARSVGNGVEIVDLQTGAIERSLSAQVDQVEFTAEGRWLLGFGPRVPLTVWDFESGSIAFQARAHVGAVHSIFITTDGRRLITGGEDGLVKIWDMRTGQELRTLNG
ncbi:MAG: protein kinase, partial [Planctomycetaceae bacterium]|nr:protein kinase [Planctomycetaceae bacterium]